MPRYRRIVVQLDTPLQESDGQVISSVTEALEGAGFVVHGAYVHPSSEAVEWAATGRSPDELVAGGYKLTP